MNRIVFFKPLIVVLLIMLTTVSCRNRDTIPRVDFTIDLTQQEYQFLNATGGQVYIPENGVLVAKSVTGFIALTGQCTTHGCTLEYQASYDELACPCSSCRYNSSGAVIMGPASIPLIQYATQLNGQWLRVYTP